MLARRSLVAARRGLQHTRRPVVRRTRVCDVADGVVEVSVVVVHPDRLRAMAHADGRRRPPLGGHRPRHRLTPGRRRPLTPTPLDCQSSPLAARGSPVKAPDWQSSGVGVGARSSLAPAAGLLGGPLRRPVAGSGLRGAVRTGAARRRPPTRCAPRPTRRRSARCTAAAEPPDRRGPWPRTREAPGRRWAPVRDRSSPFEPLLAATTSRSWTWSAGSAAASSVTASCGVSAREPAEHLAHRHRLERLARRCASAGASTWTSTLKM